MRRFCIVEVFRPAGRTPGLKKRLFNFQVFILVSVALVLLDPLLKTSSMLVAGLALAEEWMPQTTHAGLVMTVLATLAYGFVWDFFQYWAHRFEHRFALLWRFHAVHHGDTAFNTSTAMRSSFVSNVFRFVLVILPTLAILGAHFLPVIGALVLFSGWGFFNHANIRLSLGPLTPFISGPQWHRLHHGIAPEYQDKNFAAFFPVFDVVFGTYKGPTRGEFPPCGVEGCAKQSAFKDAIFGSSVKAH